MAKSKEVKKIEEYLEPNGKWGWFHFYNPADDTFAYKHMYHSDDMIIDNLWIWRFQQIALEAVYGIGFADIKEQKLLENINTNISEIHDFIYNNAQLKNIGLSEFDSFIMAFYILAKDYKKINKKVLSQQKIAGLYILLAIDAIIRDSKHKFIENLLFSAYRFHTILKIILPEYDAEKSRFVIYGRKKGEKIRNQVIMDYRLNKNDFWEKETKYEGKISLLMKKYNIGETTAKKYYSMLLKLG